MTWSRATLSPAAQQTMLSCRNRLISLRFRHSSAVQIYPHILLIINDIIIAVKSVQLADNAIWKRAQPVAWTVAAITLSRPQNIRAEHFPA
jgi:hypothetical protein